MRSPKGWAVAVPLCRLWQRSQLCRIFVFPPNLMLIMLKKKQFHSPLLAAPRWNIGYVSCSPQPTKKNPRGFDFFFQNSAFPRVLSLSCSELWTEGVSGALGPAAGTASAKLSLLQSGSVKMYSDLQPIGQEQLGTLRRQKEKNPKQYFRDNVVRSDFFFF